MSALESLSAIATPPRLRDDGCPSVSVALLENGKVSTRTLLAEKSHTKHVDPETIYQAASISKPITGLACAKLIEQGLFSYDTRVVDHLPEDIIHVISDEQNLPLLKQVTVAHLLSHTSGLSQGGFPGYDREPIPSDEQILSGKAPANTVRVRFDTFPGGQYSYSGGGMTVLQVFLEEVTKIPFAEMMQKTVLNPLGMTRSHFGDLDKGEKNYATAHLTAEVEANAPYHVLPELAAAGLWTTPTDLLRAVAAVQTSLRGERKAFLDKETAKKMLTQIGTADGKKGAAMGWGADEAVFAHSGGNLPGFKCYCVGSHGGAANATGEAAELKLPEGCGVAVMTNSWEGFQTVQKVVSAVWYLRDWPRFGSLSKGFSKDDIVPYPTAHEVDGEGWKAWVGKWGDWRLLDEDGGPRIGYGEAGETLGLVVGAAPKRKVTDGREGYRLVVDGMRLFVQLDWEDGERVVVLTQGERGSKVLKRS